jgi:hypothetical protein
LILKYGITVNGEETGQNRKASIRLNALTQSIANFSLAFVIKQYSHLLLPNIFVIGSAGLHPLVDFVFFKFPKPTDLVPRHISFTCPPVNGIPLDAEISRNIVYGKPPVCVRPRTGRSIFHHSSPLTLSVIGRLAMPACASHADRASYYRFTVRFAMDLTYGSFIQTNRDK